METTPCYLLAHPPPSSITPRGVERHEHMLIWIKFVMKLYNYYMQGGYWESWEMYSSTIHHHVRRVFARLLPRLCLLRHLHRLSSLPDV